MYAVASSMISPSAHNGSIQLKAKWTTADSSDPHRDRQTRSQRQKGAADDRARESHHRPDARERAAAMSPA